jgi:hypothetical protein
MVNFKNYISSVLFRLSNAIQEGNTLIILLVFATIFLVILFILFYLFALRNYLTNIDSFFKTRIREMKKDGLIASGDTLLIPVTHGKKNILPLEPGEILFFYQKCRYFFFRLSGQVRNVNIDLLLTTKKNIEDFENIGHGRIFFTSKMLVFENVRSRNKILWTEVSEIKEKFGYLLLFDREGCHAFELDNPALVCDISYNVFLKEV